MTDIAFAGFPHQKTEATGPDPRPMRPPLFVGDVAVRTPDATLLLDILRASPPKDD